MSVENYIASAAGALAEMAKQILASHGVDVDVDDLFDVDASATADTSEGEAGGEVTGENADAIFDVDIPSPEQEVKRLGDMGMAPDAARAEYAGTLSEQIMFMQTDIMEYEMRTHPNPVLKQKLDELYDRLSMLNEDIGGGETDMDSLKGYYERLETIKKDGAKLA